MSYKTEGNPLTNIHPYVHLKELIFQLLHDWYRIHQRDLPWRHTRDPYLIWLSEIILQQTRVNQGLPYYQQFTDNFPSVQAFAEADENEILRLWQGLGYYSRARNMLKTAREVVKEHNGAFPTDFEALKKLKGIGDYTASAIASFAFKLPAPVVDGNVFRFLSRLLGIDTDISSGGARKSFTEIARQLMPSDQPDIFNQAIMEFGALQCKPVAPDCEGCPFSLICYANKHNLQTVLPVKTKKTKVRLRHLNYIVLMRGDEIAMHKRTGKDVWNGLFEFILAETSHSIDTWDDFPDTLHDLKYFQKKGITSIPSEMITHQLSHQKLLIRFWPVSVPKNSRIELPEGFAFYPVSEIEHLPKPVAINNYLKKDFF